MKYIFFIIIFILLIVFLFSFSEKFTNNTSSASIDDIYFLSKEETQKFISKDEDNYIKNMSIYDLRARKVKSTNEYISNIINNGCLDFNEEQKEKLKKCSIKAKEFFDNKSKWIFACVNHTYEEGYPHTRSNIIFISPIIISYNDTELTKILIHESIHIYQRYNYSAVHDYLNKNGYSILRKKEKNSLVRANPDLNDFIYTDKNGVEMVAYYKNEYPNSINDIILTNSANEHPYEKMAYEMGDLYTKHLLTKYRNI